jgi:CheY-like chemotaxis protein
MRPGTDQELKHGLDMIRLAAERAAGLTRQLLIFGRKQTVRLVVLDLNEVVTDVEKILRRLIDERIEMTLIPDPQLGRVLADSGYLGQVLMNLVVNARDAMPLGGKISIATSNVTLDEGYTRFHPGVVPGDYVMLSVSDTGTGMSDEVKKHMFEAFFTTKPLGQGTGLGLATCQTIVQQSRGHVGVYSELGQGTTLKVYLPRVDLPLDSEARRVPRGPLPRGTETLLVVEDDYALRQLATGMLESQGYHVLTAANGRDGLQLAAEHKEPRISLVVTDIIMPVMGGKVMAERLQLTNPGLKILFTSGYTDDALAQHGALLPGMAFLPKPYSSSTLIRKVRAMLDNESDTAMIRQEDAASSLSTVQV